MTAHPETTPSSTTLGHDRAARWTRRGLAAAIAALALACGAPDRPSVDAHAASTRIEAAGSTAAEAPVAIEVVAMEVVAIDSASESGSASATGSGSESASASRSGSDTESGSATASATATRSGSATESASATGSGSAAASESPTESERASRSGSDTVVVREAATAFFDHADAPILRDLERGVLASAERGRGGRSLGFRVTFEDGTRGYFKPNQAFNGMSWNAEIAAYHLDRELGFGRVAPVVQRTFEWDALDEAAGRDGRIDELHVDEDGELVGAVIWWVPERLAAAELPDGWPRWLRVEGDPAAITPFQRPGAYRRATQARTLTPMPSEAPTPDTEDRPAELSDLIVFDYLTNNLDRWGGNNTNIRTVGEGGPIMFLDNAAAFTLRRPRNSMMDRRLHEVQRFRRATIDAIRGFDVEAYGERINEGGEILEPLHLRNLETRRQHLLSHVDQLVETHGADAVYAW